MSRAPRFVRLGDLDAVELGVLVCLLLLVAAVVLGWRAHRALRWQVNRLETSLSELDKHFKANDPREQSLGDDRLIAALRSLFDFAQAGTDSRGSRRDGSSEPDEE